MKAKHPMVVIPLAIIVLLIGLVVNNIIKTRSQGPNIQIDETVSLEDLGVEVTEVVEEDVAEEEEVPEEETNTNEEEPMEEANAIEGLEIEVLAEGSGEEAKAGDNVSVHYTGTLVDGTKFDSSVDRGTPFSFGLGAGQVIKGWDLGVAGMKVGEKRKLTIASDLAYGDRAVGDVITAGSTLVFEVELLAIK